jgi:hypothetical protein
LLAESLGIRGAATLMLHAARHGRGYHRDKGPLSVDWWLASFVPLWRLP